MPNIASLLDQLTTDLTALAEGGKFDPVFARSDETEELIKVLCNDENNNAVLVGNRGVGKTAIVESLAQRISSGDVPDNLLKKRLKQLDMGSLVHMAQSHTSDEHIVRFMQELRQSDCILFVEELEFAVNQLQQFFIGPLKMSIDEHKVPYIGAMSVPEFEAWQGDDPVMARSFMPINVSELSVEDAILVLRRGKKDYEKYHQVVISDEVVDAAVRLSAKYVTDRGGLPGKAFELIDEAASLLRRTNPDKARLRRMETELADIAQEMIELAAEMTEEQQKELKKRESQLSAELSSFRISAKDNLGELHLNVNNIVELVALWTGRSVTEIQDTTTGN